MKMKHLIVALLISLLSLVIVSCEVTESFNEAPVIKSIEMNATEAGDGLIYTGEEVTLTCNAVDPEGDNLSYNWSVEDGAGQLAGDKGVSVTWTAPDAEGVYVATCTVIDSDGATAVEHYNLHVVKYAFVTGIVINGGNDVNPNSTITLVCNISESSVEEDYKFTWMLDGTTQIGLGKMIQWRTPAEEGDYNISCVVEKVAGGVQVTEEATVCSYFNIFGTSIVVNGGSAVYPNQTIDLYCNIFYKGDEFNFTWNLVQGAAETEIGRGQSIQWRTPEEEGNWIVSVTVERINDGQVGTSYASVFSYFPVEDTFKMHGFIKDIHTNELLPDVTIIWYENDTPNTVVTDANGFYYIPEIIEGESHEMIFSCTGYATATYHLGEMYDEDIEKNFEMYGLNASFQGTVYFQQSDESIIPGAGAVVEVKIDGLKEGLMDLTPGRWTATADADGHYMFQALPVLPGMSAKVMPHYETNYVYESEALNLNLVPNGSFTHDYKIIAQSNDAPFIVSNNLEYSDGEFPVDGVFELTFSKSMDTSSIVLDFDGTLATTYDKIWEENDTKLVIDPVLALQLEKTYTVRVTSGRSVDNVPLAEVFEFNFRTPDKIKLVETNLIKVEGEEYDNYRIGDPITLRFDKDIDWTRTQEELETQDIRLLDPDDNIVEIDVTYSGNTLTITPANDLDENTGLYKLFYKVWQISESSNAFVTNNGIGATGIRFQTQSTDVLPDQVTNVHPYADIYTTAMNTIWMEWDEVAGAEHYRVYAKDNDTGADFILVEQTNADSTHHLITLAELGEKPFENGQTVTFHVTAVNTAGEGPASADEEIFYTEPGVVENLVKNELISWEVMYDSLSVQWDYVSNADYYVVEGTYDNGNTWKNLDRKFLQTDIDEDPSLDIVKYKVNLAALTFDGTFNEDRSDSIIFRVKALNKFVAEADWDGYSNEIIVMSETPDPVVDSDDPAVDAVEIMDPENIDYNDVSLDVKINPIEDDGGYPVSYKIRVQRFDGTNWLTPDTLATEYEQSTDSLYNVDFSELIDTENDELYLFSSGKALRIWVIAKNDAGTSSFDPTLVSNVVSDQTLPTQTNDILDMDTLDNTAGLNDIAVSATIIFSEPINNANPGSITDTDNGAHSPLLGAWNDTYTQRDITFVVPAGENWSGENLRISGWKDTTGNVMDVVDITLP